MHFYSALSFSLSALGGRAAAHTKLLGTLKTLVLLLPAAETRGGATVPDPHEALPLAMVPRSPIGVFFCQGLWGVALGFALVVDMAHNGENETLTPKGRQEEAQGTDGSAVGVGRTHRLHDSDWVLQATGQEALHVQKGALVVGPHSEVLEDGLAAARVQDWHASAQGVPLIPADSDCRL